MSIYFKLTSCRHTAQIQDLSSSLFRFRFLQSISYQTRTMKRKAESPELSARKSARGNGYCSVEPKRDSLGNQIWPAPEDQMIAARAFLKEWYGCAPGPRLFFSDLHSATTQKPTLIVPDKDADGLSSGVIIHRTLVKLGLNPGLLDVHLVQKGSNIHAEDERKLMLAKKPSFIIVLDQGSRTGPPVVDAPETKSLIIDHHFSDDEFPKDAQVS
jgi:hypothetical protein